MWRRLKVLRDRHVEQWYRRKLQVCRGVALQRCVDLHAGLHDEQRHLSRVNTRVSNKTFLLSSTSALGRQALFSFTAHLLNKEGRFKPPHLGSRNLVHTLLSRVSQLTIS
eukprot:2791626-Amphidinium_carterae.1